MTSTPVNARRPRAARGQGASLGQEIVAAALEVVDGPGAPALTLRGVARAIGVSAPAIYAHFADVDAILLAVAERAFDELAQHLDDATVDVQPADRLRAVCRAYLGYAQSHPGRYLVMFGGQWDATAAAERGTVGPDAAAQLGHEVLTLIAEAVEGSRRPRAGATAVPAMDDAVIVWVFLHGYAHQRLVARAFPWPPAMTELLLDRLAGALGPQPLSTTT